jgi:hypothetical protein
MPRLQLYSGKITTLTKLRLALRRESTFLSITLKAQVLYNQPYKASKVSNKPPKNTLTYVKEIGLLSRSRYLGSANETGLIGEFTKKKGEE